MRRDYLIISWSFCWFFSFVLCWCLDWRRWLIRRPLRASAFTSMYSFLMFTSLRTSFQTPYKPTVGELEFVLNTCNVSGIVVVPLLLAHVVLVADVLVRNLVSPPGRTSSARARTSRWKCRTAVLSPRGCCWVTPRSLSSGICWRTFFKTNYKSLLFLN